MSLTVTGKARLVTDPKRGRTGAGKAWANAVLRVVNFKKTDTGWEEHSSFSCTGVAFEDAAFKLAEFVKGDEIEFTGRVRELKIWTPERGDPRAQLGLALDSVTAPPPRKKATRDGPPTDANWPRPAVPGESPAAPADNVVQLHGGDSSARLLRAHQSSPVMQRQRTRGGRPA